MSAIQRIRKAVREGRYVFTDHARDEARADGLRLSEVIDVLLSAYLESTLTDDPRGPRYVVVGKVGDIAVAVVCRFREDGTLLIIITVFVVD